MENRNYTIKTLITEEQLKEGIKQVADRINREYEGKAVHLIGILKGGVYFLTELSKSLTADVTIDFICVSSYGADTQSSGVVRLIKDLDDSIEGKNVIVVEDIIDTGNTLSYLMNLLNGRNPASLKLCTMLDKPSRRVQPLEADWSAFTIPDYFVVGYGLDYDQKHRNLPYIGEVVFNEKQE